MGRRECGGSAIFARAAEQWQAMRRDYQDCLEAQLARAQAELGPYLARRDSPVDAEALFTGPWERAAAHASPELLEWWERNGRMTVTEYERQWLDAQDGTL